MFSQLFGRYLVEKSLLNEDDYKLIIEKQMSVRVRLGTIAVADGILTEDQVDEINQLQRQLDKRFGDIAVEKNYLSPEQVEALLAKQGDSYMQFVQLLTDMTDLSNSDIATRLKDFQKESGFSDQELDALKHDDIDRLMPVFVISSKPYVSDIAALVIRNFTRFISRDFYIEKAKRLQELPYAFLAYQELAGDDSVFIAITEETDNGAFLKTASRFSHEEMEQVTADTYDAICELINVTSGILASSLSKEKVTLDMEPPMAFKNQTIKGDFYVLPIHLEGTQIDLVISVNSDFTAGENPINTGTVVQNIPVSKSSDSKASVLIVDDSKMSRSMLRNILEKANFTVVAEAANGEEGLETYKKCKPDLVTLDITMPKMDGLEALENILAFDPDAKAVMITAAGQQDKLIKALKVGAKRFISKPFNEEEIINNIHDVLNS